MKEGVDRNEHSNVHIHYCITQGVDRDENRHFSKNRYVMDKP